MNLIWKIVRYDMYCKDCKYEKTEETEDPCNDCLNQPVNENTQKPIRWEAK